MLCSSRGRDSVPSDDLAKVIERSEQIIIGNEVPKRSKKFKTYAVSNFRGGIGKSTLTFNLAYEISRLHRTLLLDACSQKNLSQAIFGEQLAEMSFDLYKALISQITNTSGVPIDELIVRANAFFPAFAGGKPLFRPNCVFRGKVATNSTPKRPPIPRQSGH